MTIASALAVGPARRYPTRATCNTIEMFINAPGLGRQRDPKAAERRLTAPERTSTVLNLAVVIALAAFIDRVLTGGEQVAGGQERGDFRHLDRVETLREPLGVPRHKHANLTSASGLRISVSEHPARSLRSTMQIAGSTALVTGAGRGLGRYFAQVLLERGAARVYATARCPETIDIAGVTPLALDVTDPDSITAAATAAPDVDLLINNAGVSAFTDLVTGDLDDIRREVETNFFGPLQVIRAFAPTLASHGGGAVLNVLSALSWISYQGSAGYAAAKAAAWSMTNGVRLELSSQHTQVTGLVMASTDTDMMAGFDVPKNNPIDVVRAALDGIEHGEIEVIADRDSATIKAALAAHPTALYPSLTTGQSR